MSEAHGGEAFDFKASMGIPAEVHPDTLRLVDEHNASMIRGIDKAITENRDLDSGAVALSAFDELTMLPPDQMRAAVDLLATKDFWPTRATAAMLAGAYIELADSPREAADAVADTLDTLADDKNEYVAGSVCTMAEGYVAGAGDDPFERAMRAATVEQFLPEDFQF